eukprot:2268471-Rhodomonas_salina.1
MHAGTVAALFDSGARCGGRRLRAWEQLCSQPAPSQVPAPASTFTFTRIRLLTRADQRSDLIDSLGAHLLLPDCRSRSPFNALCFKLHHVSPARRGRP